MFAASYQTCMVWHAGGVRAQQGPVPSAYPVSRRSHLIQASIGNEDNFNVSCCITWACLLEHWPDIRIGRRLAVQHVAIFYPDGVSAVKYGVSIPDFFLGLCVKDDALSYDPIEHLHTEFMLCLGKQQYWPGSHVIHLVDAWHHRPRTVLLHRHYSVCLFATNIRAWRHSVAWKDV